MQISPVSPVLTSTVGSSSERMEISVAGSGHVMNTFFMCCAPTREEAMAVGLGPCNTHLKGLADAAKEWLTGASTKDYPGYDKLMAHVLAGISEGWLKVPIEGVFPLSQAAEMHRRLEGRHVAGKLLLQAGRPS